MLIKAASRTFLDRDLITPRPGQKPLGGAPLLLGVPRPPLASRPFVTRGIGGRLLTHAFHISFPGHWCPKRAPWPLTLAFACACPSSRNSGLCPFSADFCSLSRATPGPLWASGTFALVGHPPPWKNNKNYILQPHQYDDEYIPSWPPYDIFIIIIQMLLDLGGCHVPTNP